MEGKRKWDWNSAKERFIYILGLILVNGEQVMSEIEK